jgi:hypothetical protein
MSSAFCCVGRDKICAFIGVFCPPLDITAQLWGVKIKKPNPSVKKKIVLT